jgi:hypothetical protein
VPWKDRGPLLEQGLERAPVNVRQHHEQPARILFHAVDAADVGVIERGERLRLALEAAARLGIVREVLVDELEATLRSSLVSWATQTSPMPPAPSLCSIRKWRSVVPIIRGVRARRGAAWLLEVDRAHERGPARVVVQEAEFGAVFDSMIPPSSSTCARSSQRNDSSTSPRRPYRVAIWYAASTG